MPKFRKKPVVIEATQLTAEMINAHVLDAVDLPAGVHLVQANFHRANRVVFSARCAVDTLEGRMSAEPGCWIITGVMGEHYSCDPEIFEATYEPCEDA